MSLAPQRVVCAANRINGIVVPSARHWDPVMRALIKVLDQAGEVYSAANVEQGFIDQFGNFLTRKEAFVIATNQGQIREKSGNPNSKELFSEDLY